MSVEQMRTAIARVYDGEKWKRRVLYMSDLQVIAIYNSFLEKGKLK